MKQLLVKNWDLNYPVGKYFKLGELVCSDWAYAHEMFVQYVHRDDILKNLEVLCARLLDPLRVALGVPILINSGYRCAALNQSVGGVANSLHKYGQAADIRGDFDFTRAAEIVREMDFHECLIYNRYIHLSYKNLWNERKFRDYRK